MMSYKTIYYHKFSLFEIFLNQQFDYDTYVNFRKLLSCKNYEAQKDLNRAKLYPINGPSMRAFNLLKLGPRKVRNSQNNKFNNLVKKKKVIYLRVGLEALADIAEVIRLIEISPK